MSKSPRIRFRQFSADWEQRKLGELVQFSKGTGYSKGDLKDSGTPIILYGRLYTKHETVIANVDTFADAKKGSVYSRGGEVLVPASGETAKDISVASVVEKSGVLLGGDLNIITPPEDLDPAFLAINISNGKPHEEMAKMAQGKSVVHLHNTDLEKVDLVYPSHEEQTQISGFFSSIDALITLHQHKLSKYKDIRTGLLQEMFCSDSSQKPETRFSEYTGEWEKMPLSKVLISYTDYLPTPTDGYTRLGIRSHMKGTFYEYVAPSKQLGEKRLQRVQRDNFIVNIVFAWEHAIAVTTEEDEGKLVSHRFPQFSFNEGMYPRFFHYALNDERFRHHLWLASPSGAGRNKTLRIDEMLEYELRVPKYEEQKKIADFLTSLDELIELYDYRITKLQSIKTACLQGMFV